MRKLLTIILFLISGNLFAQFNSLNAYRGPFGYIPPYELPQLFTYVLDTSSLVSEGIYNSDSVLVRTLVSTQQYAAGPHIEVWDGLDDNGNTLPTGQYTAKVVSNNIYVVWEGGIGNTSSSFTGYGVHKGNHPPDCMAIYGSTAYFGVDYNEQNTCTSKFTLTNIQVRQPIDFIAGAVNITPSVYDCATDGTSVYWLGVDANSSTKSFAYATNCNADTTINLSSGTAYAITFGKTYSTIGFSSITAERGNSIALYGSYLYLARPLANRIDYYNKNTGAYIGTVSTTNPANIRVDGTVLWCGHSTTVEKFTINVDGSLTSAGTPITGLLSVQAIAINPITGNIYVADGSTSQQIRIYNTSGTLQSTWGTAGGYLSNAIVSDTKWYWNDAGNTYKVFLCFDAGGGLWINDPGNCRMQHYNSSQTFVERIQWMLFNYNIGVDDNNPTRIFANALEFSRNYSQTLSGSTGWAQVANWRGQLTGTQYSQYQGLLSLLTFANGKTYCFVNASGTTLQLIELKSDGTIRFTGQTFSNAYYIDRSGDLYSYNIATNGQAVTQKKRAFTSSYDGNGTPVWGGTDITLHSTPVLSDVSNEPTYKGNFTDYRPNNYMSDSTLILYDESKTNTGYHLGAAKNGKWLWKTALATYPTYSGNMPDPSRFDIGNTVNFAGGTYTTVDNITYANYHGEFWSQTQCNIDNMYDDTTGLPLYQIGVAPKLTPPARQAVLAGDAGNAFSIKVIKANGNIYLFHNDEGIGAKVHSWKINNLSSIKRVTTTLQNAGIYYSNAVNSYDMLAGLPNTKGNSVTGLNYAKWSFSTLPYSNSGLDYWKLSTGSLIYDKKNPDLSIGFASPVNVTKMATCNLLTLIPPGLTGWTLDMTMNFQFSNDNFTNGTSSNKYIDLLDTAGKIIFRFYHATTTYPSVGFFANTTNLYNAGAADATTIKNGLNRLVITSAGGNVSAQFSSSVITTANTSVGVFQTGANPLAPAFLKITFLQNGGTSYGINLDVQKASFYPSTL